MSTLPVPAGVSPVSGTAPPPRQRGTLSPKQRSFIDHYCGDSHFNACDAARRAGYADAGVSGMENKHNPIIRALIEARLDAESLTQQEILHELTSTALAPTSHFMLETRGEYVDDHGNRHDAQIRMDYGAKMKALELLGKNRRMFTDNVNVEGGVTVVVREYREGNPVQRDPDDPDGGGI